jgi:hypothetical protein
MSRYTTPMHLKPAARICFLLLATPLLAACAIYTPLQIESVRKAPPIAPRFSESYYSYDRDQTVSFVLHSSTTDAASGKPVEQVTTIRVFWRPKGGATTLNPSALNATFRYVIMTSGALGIYEGAGFVLLNSRTGAGSMRARVMDSDMRLTQKTESFTDNLGRARMRGTFVAKYNDEKTADMLLETQQEFFGKSLENQLPRSPATAPIGATLPATTLP